MQILSLPVIAISLVCLVPWAVIAVLAILLDYGYAWWVRKNPEKLAVTATDDESQPEPIKPCHHELITLNFQLVGTFEGMTNAGRRKFWVYEHPAHPEIVALAKLSLGGVDGVVEMITVFEKMVIITSHGGASNERTAHTTINLVETGISAAFEFHQRIIASDTALYGQPRDLPAREAYLEYANGFRIKYFNEFYFGEYQVRQLRLVLFTVTATLVGLVGGYLTFTLQLDGWQSVLVAALLVGVVGVLIWEHTRNPAIVSLEAKTKKKKAASIGKTS